MDVNQLINNMEVVMLYKSYIFLSHVLLSGLFCLSAQAINPNTASVDDLADELIGVGPKLAMKIVEFREQNGKFEDIEDLMLVNGIGNAVIDKNKDLLEFE